jgi:hypothetical protein
VRQSALGPGAKSPSARHSKRPRVSVRSSCRPVPAINRDQAAASAAGVRLRRCAVCGGVRCAAATSARPAPRPAGPHPRSLCGAARRPAAPAASGAGSAVSRPPQNGDTPHVGRGDLPSALPAVVPRRPRDEGAADLRGARHAALPARLARASLLLPAVARDEALLQGTPAGWPPQDLLLARQSKAIRCSSPSAYSTATGRA